MSNATDNEKCNMVWLAGILKFVRADQGGGGYFLIDTQSDSRFIPCTIFKDAELSGKLAKFRSEDFIKVKGFARAWSQKAESGYVNHLEIRVTEISCKVPDRAQVFDAQQSRGRGGQGPQERQRRDDEVPF